MKQVETKRVNNDTWQITCKHCTWSDLNRKSNKQELEAQSYDRTCLDT